MVLIEEFLRILVTHKVHHNHREVFKAGRNKKPGGSCQSLRRLEIGSRGGLVSIRTVCTDVGKIGVFSMVFPFGCVSLRLNIVPSIKNLVLIDGSEGVRNPIFLGSLVPEPVPEPAREKRVNQKNGKGIRTSSQREDKTLPWPRHQSQS